MDASKHDSEAPPQSIVTWLCKEASTVINSQEFSAVQLIKVVEAIGIDTVIPEQADHALHSMLQLVAH